MKSSSSFIKRSFPVPRLLILSDVSVDFLDGRLSFFEFSRSQGALKPKAYGAQAFPRLHRDMKEDEEAFAEAGKVLKAFAASKGYELVRAVLHEGDAYVFKLRVPALSYDEVRAAIESALEENVPIPPSEAIFEYETVKVDRVRGETVTAVTVISSKVIADNVGLLDAAGMTPVTFETESRSLARALFGPDDADSHAVLSIRDRHTIVFVVESGKVTFSSSIEVGSIDLERSVSKTFEVTIEEAKSLMSGSLIREGIDETKLFESMIPVFATMRDELGKMLVYSRADAHKEHYSEIVDIVLSGSAARLPGFARYISITSKLPAKVGSVWTNILSPEKAVPELGERESLDYGSLIGIHIS